MTPGPSGSGFGRRIDFDLATLRLFEAAVRLGSISGAAEEGNIAVSAVSKRLADLEHQVGTALLHRTGRGVEPTPAGRAMLEHARNLLRLAERALDDMASFADGEQGQIRIAANPSAIAEFLPDVFASFRGEVPAVEIVLRERLSDAIVRDVADGQADIGIFSATVPHDGIETFPLIADRLCAAVPAAHPLADKDRVRFDDLLPFPFVALEDGSSLALQFESLARARDRVLNVAVRVRSFDGVRRMTSRGLGVGILPAATVEPYAVSDGLRAVTLDEPWATRGFLAGVRERRALSRIAERFLAHLLDRVGGKMLS